MPNEHAASCSCDLLIGVPGTINKLRIDIVWRVHRDLVRGGTATEATGSHETCAETNLS